MKLSLLTFKWTALLEGASFLLLLFICMPLKYGAGILWPNKIMGLAHGVLTVIYLSTLLNFAFRYEIGFVKTLSFLIMSFLPFGTFYAERKWLRPLEASSENNEGIKSDQKKSEKMKQSNFKEASEGWILAGIIFSVLGGWGGLVIGANYVRGNYNKQTKNKGWIMIVIGIVVRVIITGL